MVVMAGQVFGKLEAAEVVGARNASSHTRVTEHRQVAVGRALGNAYDPSKDLDDRERSVRGGEGLDQRPPAAGIALLDCEEPVLGNVMQAAPLCQVLL
jgi:hypothetical protein